MGTTTKGLRYPEATVLGNTLHTRIKELADDANTALVSRDARLDGLDVKTDATNVLVNARGVPLTRNGGYLASANNLPNNFTWLTTHSIYGIVVIPSNAVTAHVSFQVAGHVVANAQCTWDPLYSTDNGANWLHLVPSTLTMHNQGNAAMNMGFSVAGLFDVRAARGQTIAIALNGRNDPGSGGWVQVGYLHWSVTVMS